VKKLWEQVQQETRGELWEETREKIREEVMEKARAEALEKVREEALEKARAEALEKDREEGLEIKREIAAKDRTIEDQEEAAGSRHRRLKRTGIQPGPLPGKFLLDMKSEHDTKHLTV
jgi:hypothetical protein